MADFRKLHVWKLGCEYTLAIYEATARFPKEERYGLAAHLRKTAISVASNIAEGGSRESPKEFLQFVGYAEGSLGEARTQTYLAGRLGYIDQATMVGLARRARQIRAMLAARRRRGS